MTEHQKGAENYEIMDLTELDNVAAFSRSSLDVWLKLLTKHIAKLIVDHTELQKKLEPDLDLGADNGAGNRELKPDEVEIADKMKSIQGSIQALSAKQRNVIHHLRSSATDPTNSNDTSNWKLSATSGKNSSLLTLWLGETRKRTIDSSQIGNRNNSCGPPKKLVCETPSTSSAIVQKGVSTRSRVHSKPSRATQTFTLQQRQVFVPGYRSHYAKTQIRHRRPESAHPNTYVSKLEFMTALGLVTIDVKKQIITDLGKNKVGRTRRSTANPKYASDALNTAYNVLYPRRRNTEAIVLEDLTRHQRHSVYKQMHRVDNGFNELLLKCYDCNTLWCNIRCDVCHTNFHTDCIRIQGSKASRPKYLRKCPKCVDDRAAHDILRARAQRIVKRTKSQKALREALRDNTAYQMKRNVLTSHKKSSSKPDQQAGTSRSSRLRTRPETRATSSRVNTRRPCETVTSTETGAGNKHESPYGKLETNGGKNNAGKKNETNINSAAVAAEANSNSKVNHYDFSDELEASEELPSTSADKMSNNGRFKVKDSITRTLESVVSKSREELKHNEKLKTQNTSESQESAVLTAEDRKKITDAMDFVGRQTRITETIGSVVSEAKKYSMAKNTKADLPSDMTELGETTHRTKRGNNQIEPNKLVLRDQGKVKTTKKNANSKANDTVTVNKKEQHEVEQKPGSSKQNENSKKMEEIFDIVIESAVSNTENQMEPVTDLENHLDEDDEDMDLPMIIDYPAVTQSEETVDELHVQVVSSEETEEASDETTDDPEKEKPKKEEGTIDDDTMKKIQQLDDYLRSAAKEEQLKKDREAAEEEEASRRITESLMLSRARAHCSTSADAWNKMATNGKPQRNAKDNSIEKKDLEEQSSSNFSKSLDAIFKAVCSGSDIEEKDASHSARVGRPLSSIPATITSSTEALNSEVALINATPYTKEQSLANARRVGSPDITMLPLRKKKRQNSSEITKMAGPPSASAQKSEPGTSKGKSPLMKMVTVRTIIPGLNNPVTTFTPADIYAKSQKLDKKLSTTPYSQFKATMGVQEDATNSHYSILTKGETGQGAKNKNIGVVSSEKEASNAEKLHGMQFTASNKSLGLSNLHGASPKQACSVNSTSPGKPVSTLTDLSTTGQAVNCKKKKNNKNAKKKETELEIQNETPGSSGTSYCCSTTKGAELLNDTNYKGRDDYCIRNVSINCDTCRELRLKGSEDPELNNGGCNGPKGSSNGLANLPKTCITVTQTIKAMSAAALSVLNNTAKAISTPVSVDGMEEVTADLATSSTTFAKTDSGNNSIDDKQSMSNELFDSAAAGSSSRIMRSQCRAPSPRPQSPRLPDRFTDQQRQQLIDTNGEIMREVIDLKSTDLDLDTSSDRGRSPSPSRLSDISTPESSLKSF